MGKIARLLHSVKTRNTERPRLTSVTTKESTTIPTAIFLSQISNLTRFNPLLLSNCFRRIEREASLQPPFWKISTDALWNGAITLLSFPVTHRFTRTAKLTIHAIRLLYQFQDQKLTSNGLSPTTKIIIRHEERAIQFNRTTKMFGSPHQTIFAFISTFSNLWAKPTECTNWFYQFE